MTIQCPCCGGEMRWAMPREELANQFSGFHQMRGGRSWIYPRLLYRLCRKVGHIVSLEEASDFVWGDDEDGGPEQVRISLSSYISKNKSKLASYGWEIITHHGRGWEIRTLRGLQERQVSASTMVMSGE